MQPSSLQMIHQHQMLGPPIGKDMGHQSWGEKSWYSQKRGTKKMLTDTTKNWMRHLYFYKKFDRQGSMHKVMQLWWTPYQGAPPISPERSTRQWTCVFVRAFLYAPLTVRMYAYSHTIAIVKITENRSNTGFATWIAWGKYCSQDNYISKLVHL